MWPIFPRDLLTDRNKMGHQQTWHLETNSKSIQHCSVLWDFNRKALFSRANLTTYSLAFPYWWWVNREKWVHRTLLQQYDCVAGSWNMNNVQRSLSNDPDKNCSIFYCSAAICFPPIEIVVFSNGECINQWKAGLWNKMYLNSILKASLVCVQTFSTNHSSFKQRQ